MRRVNWKVLAGGGVALLVLLYLVKGTFSGVSVPSIGGGSSTGSSNSSSTSPAQTPKRVTVNGQSIAAGGQPTLLLNPGLVKPGSKVTANGSGFDPGASVKFLVKGQSADDKGTGVAVAKADKGGSVTVTFTVPDSQGSTSSTVVAQQSGGDGKSAQAQMTVPAGVGTVKLSKTVGKPGDRIGLSAAGFSPGEGISVSWGRLGGKPAAKLQADASGNVARTSIQVGVGASGNSTLVLIGDKSRTVATAAFTMLSLYPSVKVAPYALKAGQQLTISGSGFAPSEQVAIYVNNTGGQPLLTAQASPTGSLSSPGFIVPFGLKGRQTLALVGQESRATVSSGFLILPYSPSAQPSTWGGFPGTTLSFYASGFAPNEVVLVYTGRSQNSAGELVTAFRANGQGKAAAAGKYVIPGDAQGKLTFSLVGRQSEGVAAATITVQHSDQAANIPAQPKYQLPPDLATDNPGGNKKGSSNNQQSAPAPSAAPPPPTDQSTPQPAPSDQSSQPPSQPAPGDQSSQPQPAPSDQSSQPQGSDNPNGGS